MFLTKHRRYLLAVILVGISLRIFFFIGHIFSDDAYYSYLSYSLLKGNLFEDYLGYPIFTLRLTHLSFTALSFFLLGISEFSSSMFPMLFSVGNIFLAYLIAKEFLSDERTALISAFLLAVFPTDVVFAGINFADSVNAFFIYAGVLFLIKGYKSQRASYAVISGLFLFFSCQTKENIYYVLILLILFLISAFVHTKRIDKILIIPLLLIISNFIIEGVIYYFLNGNFLHRFDVIKSNYEFSYYDFFPSSIKAEVRSNDYWSLLATQVILNLKHIFLRRFYLFLPVLALIESIILIKNKEKISAAYWFLILAFLMIGFTASFSGYYPLDLKRSWYVYPLMIPVVILSAMFINRFKRNIRTSFLLLIFFFSLYMNVEYEKYFDSRNLTSLKNFLRDNKDKMIYTDHFTKYSVDLIREYSPVEKSKRILSAAFDFNEIGTGECVLFNQKHIKELKLQKFDFPDFGILNSDEFELIKKFGDFKVFSRK